MSTPTARMPITAYAVSTGSRLPEVLEEAAVVLDLVGEPLRALLRALEVGGVGRARRARRTRRSVPWLMMVVTTSARNPRRALKSDPIGSSFRKRPARRDPCGPFRHNAPCAECARGGIGQERPDSAPHASTVCLESAPAGIPARSLEMIASGEPTVAGQRRHSTGFPR